MYTPTAYDIHSFLAWNKSLKKAFTDFWMITVSKKGKHTRTSSYSWEQQLPLLCSIESAKTWYNSNFIDLLDFWCWFDITCILLALRSGIFVTDVIRKKTVLFMQGLMAWWKYSNCPRLDTPFSPAMLLCSGE